MSWYGPSALHVARGYFRMIKRILTKNLHRRGFPKTAIQAAERIRFGMRERYLAPSDHNSLLRLILIHTKYCNYVLSVGNIYRVAWIRVFDDPVLSHYFWTSLFPVLFNHHNIKNILSYKNKISSKICQIGNISITFFRNLIDQSLRNAERHCKFICARFYVSVIGQCIFLLFCVI